MRGLTFFVLAQSPAARKRWRDEDRARTQSLDRHKRLMLRVSSELPDEERQVLSRIDEQLQSSELAASDKICPECSRPFVIVSVKGVEIDCCRFCRSMWFDPGELQVFSGQDKEIPSDNLTSRASRYDCPVCQAQMTEFVFLNPHNLLVDRCPNGHGVYLEDRELERVFEIV